MSRILILADTFPPNRGGSEAYLVVLAEGLAQRGHDVQVFTPAAQVKDHSIAHHANLQVSRSTIWKKLQLLGAHQNKYVNRISRLQILPLIAGRSLGRKYDVVIAGHLLPAGIVAGLLKKLKFCKRVVVITYGEEVATYRHGDRMARLMRKAFAAADAITVLTQAAFEEIKEVAPDCASKVTIVPPSAEIPAEQPAAGIAEFSGEPIILTVSRLAERKGIDTTIRAMKRVMARFPDAHYYIAGTGPYESVLRDLISDLDLGESITLLGPVPDTALLFGRCDMFCMPNRTLPNGEKEGFGIVFLEAGLHGKPSIAGKSGGAVDAVIDGETGILVNPGDTEDTAAAILKLAENAEYRHQLGAAALDFAKTFTHERQVNSFEKLIQSLLQR